MLKLFKELIINAQGDSLFTGTHRNLEIAVVEKKATILIRVRRCGMSALMNQVINRLISAGIPKENFLFINFF